MSISNDVSNTPDLRNLTCPYCFAPELEFSVVDSGMVCPECHATWDGDGIAHRPGDVSKPTQLELLRKRLQEKCESAHPGAARGSAFAEVLTLLDEIEAQQ